MTIRARFTCCFLLLCLGTWNFAPAADDLPLKFRKPVTLEDPAESDPAQPQGELLSVALDADVYAQTQDSLADVRILDPQGKPIPYLLQLAQARKAEKLVWTWNASNPALKPLGDEGLEITVHLQKSDPQPESLRLITPLSNFEQRVEISTSADGETWNKLESEAMIFDYSQFMDVRRDRIPLPKTGDRYFRLVVERVTAEQESQLMELTKTLQGGDETERTERAFIQRRPFRIERIEFSAEVETELAAGPRTIEYPVVKLETVEKPKEKQTWLNITTRREPLVEFRVNTNSKNFSRRAEVQVGEYRGSELQFRTIGSGTLSSIDFRSIHQHELSLDFSETRATQYRIVIDNRDNPPVSVEEVVALGRVYELLFLAPEDSLENKFELAYGGEIEAASYDTAAIAAVSKKFAPQATKLGAEKELAPGELPSAEFRWSDLFNNKPLLFGTIAVLVIALGWGLYQAAKRVDNMPEE